MSEVKTDFYDGDNGDLIVRKSQRVDKIIEHNQALKNEINHNVGNSFVKSFKPGTMVNAGNIPMVVVIDVMKTNGLTLQDFLQGKEEAKEVFKKWFNQPNNPFNAGVRI